MRHWGKGLLFISIGILLSPAIAGFFTNQKDELRDAFQKARWSEVIDKTDQLLESDATENQKDLYRLVQAMALFQKSMVDESIDTLAPIKEKSLYSSWAKLFLARLAYITDQRVLLEDSLEVLFQTPLKGDIKQEAKFYESYLLVKDERWKEAEKIIKPLERQSRGSEIHPSVLENLALIESHTQNTTAVCKTLKKIYIKYPKHIWFEATAPEIKDISLGKKKISCLVTDKDFDSRRRNLNLMGESARLSGEDGEIQKWIRKAKLPLKKQKLLLAQQSVAEGRPDEAQKILKEIPQYQSDVEVLNPLSFAAARAGDMTAAIEAALAVHSISGFSKTGTMALYQAALWSYQTRDYDHAEVRFKKLKLFRLSRAYGKEVQWYLGWLRYLKGDYLAAEKSFRVMLKSRQRRNANSSKDSIERVNYWLAMSLLQRGRKDQARDIFIRLSEKKGLSYYSILAKERLKLLPEIKATTEAEAKLEWPTVAVAGNGPYRTPYVEMVPRPSVKEMEEEEANLIAEESGDESGGGTEDESASGNTEVAVAEGAAGAESTEDTATESQPTSEFFTQNESQLKIERAKAFWSVGLDELARREVSDLERSRTGFDLLKKLTEEYRAMGLYNRLSVIGTDFLNRADWNSNKFIYEAVYPRAFAEDVEAAATETNVAKSLIWGIMKAESMYRPWVKSPVGALGLMQVMPTTGQKLAEIIDYKNFSPSILLQPQEAIRFGSKYLERLGKKFDHTVQLVAAAYNAGPHRVSQWLYYFGYMQMDEWVEHIPFLETRNYVKRVTVNYMAYNELYGKDHGQELALIGPVPVQLAGAPETSENWE